jgi:hypothetical protein
MQSHLNVPQNSRGNNIRSPSPQPDNFFELQQDQRKLETVKLIEQDIRSSLEVPQDPTSVRNQNMGPCQWFWVNFLAGLNVSMINFPCCNYFSPLTNPRSHVCQRRWNKPIPRNSFR